MNRKKTGQILLLLLFLLMTLTGCRERLLPEAGGTDGADGPSLGTILDAGEGEAGTVAGTAAGTDPAEGPDARDSDRKVYAEQADTELLPEMEHGVFLQGQGSGRGAPGEERLPAERFADEAERQAQLRVPAEEAERRNVSDTAPEADSARAYYEALLEARSGSLYECKRLNVYWETEQDLVTIHKSAPEHALILGAGSYDVSARLLPENLQVTADWVVRKNPELIVRVMAHVTPAGARAVLSGMRGRPGWQAVSAVRTGRMVVLGAELLASPGGQTLTKLVIAKAADPELYRDVDLAQAGRELTNIQNAAPGRLWYWEEEQ